MILITANNEQWTDVGTGSPADGKRMLDVMKPLPDDLQKSGELVDVNGLSGAAHAKMVRARQGGDPVGTDGPFSESKEFLAGYWVVDVVDEARAIEIAARASSAPGPGGEPQNG